MDEDQVIKIGGQTVRLQADDGKWSPDPGTPSTIAIEEDPNAIVAPDPKATNLVVGGGCGKQHTFEHGHVHCEVCVKLAPALGFVVENCSQEP